MKFINDDLSIRIEQHPTILDAVHIHSEHNDPDTAADAGAPSLVLHKHKIASLIEFLNDVIKPKRKEARAHIISLGNGYVVYFEDKGYLAGSPPLPKHMAGQTQKEYTLNIYFANAIIFSTIKRARIALNSYQS